MLQEENLKEIDSNGGGKQYEEPEGEIVEIFGQGSNTLSVLTRVSRDKEAESRSESPPIDPTEMTVSELRTALNDRDYDNEELTTLFRVEENGKNRTTAINSIREQIDG
jgi:hypothetical protein